MWQEVTYRVQVFTGTMLWSSTQNAVYIRLVGASRKSERMLLSGSFTRGSDNVFKITCSASLGDLVLIELDTEPLLKDDEWFCSKVVVSTPEGDTAQFPCYHWLQDSKMLMFREGTAKKVYNDVLPIAMYERTNELQRRSQEYTWTSTLEGIPMNMLIDTLHTLPPEVRFSFIREREFIYTTSEGLAELKLKGLADKQQSWTSFEDMEEAFSGHRTNKSDYVQAHWREDSLFGYQFLNGLNPMVIRRCDTLPPNFAVTDQMVQPFIQDGSSLQQEMLNGNIFLCDYKTLDGMETRLINGKAQYQAAPLCLLYSDPQNQLMPIAIQLKQQPGDMNPVFLPSDSDYDWMLAKMFVRNADFNVHQLIHHLLRTHMLTEVFTLATLRNLPMVHPIYKLLIPHTRYTLQINYLARKLIISADGVFTQYAGLGGKGMIQMLKDGTSSLTYSSLCIPEDIAARGLESVPNFYYRDDGLALWKIIYKFAKGVVSCYYPTDLELQKDTELQRWINEIFTKGFLGNTNSGIPQSLTSVAKFVKLLTMMIFTMSAQHAAVNSGQYDFDSWVPNAPVSMKIPPPTMKGSTDLRSIFDALPDVNASVHGIATVWLLSRRSSDFVSLGHYPEEQFTEPTPRRLIREFQRDLSVLTASIKERNAGLLLPYTYLCPEEVENSVAI